MAVYFQPPVVGSDAVSTSGSIKTASVRMRSSLNIRALVGSVRRKTMASSTPKLETKLTENVEPSSSSPVVRSKSRLVRMLISKKQPKEDDTPRPSRLPAPTSAYSKEQRDAALRARGLLPPLPLSEQERVLDNTIPVVRPGALPADVESEADLIKKQWESKNKEVEEGQRERLDAFKFGSSPSNLSSSTNEPTDDSRSSTSDSAQTKAQRRQGMHQASLSQPMRIEADALRDIPKRSYSLQKKSLPNVPVGETPVTPMLDLPTEFQSYLDTPPSTKQSAAQLTPNELAVSSVRSTPVREVHARRTPFPVKIGEKQLTHPPSPLPTPNSAVSPTDTLFDATHRPTDSSPRESGSSSSLDSTFSTIKSSDSHTNGQGAKIVVKSVENVIPIILENPVGSGAHEAAGVEHDEDVFSSSGHGHDDADEFLPPPPVPPRDAARIRKRGIVDPPSPDRAVDKPLPNNPTGDTPTRRKTLNPFKRNQQLDDGAAPTRRSFAMLGRSVVGSVMRPRRDAENGVEKQQERSLSPTRAYYRQPPPSQPPVVRQAVNPVYYSGGDIHAQASTIKDEEERRMAELAFLS